MKKRAGSMFTAKERASLKEHSALLQQAITRQEIAEGDQSYPAISIEDERDIFIKAIDGDLKKNELLATVRFKNIAMKILSTHVEEIEFINEPVAIGPYMSDLAGKQDIMKRAVIEFLVSSFRLDPETKYYKDDEIKLGEGIIIKMEKNFAIHRVGGYNATYPQTNISLPLLDEFFDKIRQNLSLKASYKRPSGRGSILRHTMHFFLNTLSYFENDILLDENKKHNMRAIFTQMAWYAVINKITAYAIEHHGDELAKTLNGYQKNLQPVLIRLDNKSIREIVGKLEFFVKAHESQIMDFKVASDIGDLISKDLKFLFGENDTMKRALNEVTNSFTNVRDLFSFAREVDVTKLYDSTQYPLTKVLGYDGAVYEHRTCPTFYPEEYDGLAQLIQDYDQKKPANYTQDDMLCCYSHRKRLQDRKSDRSELRL